MKIHSLKREHKSLFLPFREIYKPPIAFQRLLNLSHPTRWSQTVRHCREESRGRKTRRDKTKSRWPDQGWSREVVNVYVDGRCEKEIYNLRVQRNEESIRKEFLSREWCKRNKDIGLCKKRYCELTFEVLMSVQEKKLQLSGTWSGIRVNSKQLTLQLLRWGSFMLTSSL